MNNYKVKALKTFFDTKENLYRIEGKEFVCEEERYNIFASKDAIELIEVIKEANVEEVKEEKKKKKIIKKKEK